MRSEGKKICDFEKLPNLLETALSLGGRPWGNEHSAQAPAFCLSVVVSERKAGPSGSYSPLALSLVIPQVSPGAGLREGTRQSNHSRGDGFGRPQIWRLYLKLGSRGWGEQGPDLDHIYERLHQPGSRRSLALALEEPTELRGGLERQ